MLFTSGNIDRPAPERHNKEIRSLPGPVYALARSVEALLDAVLFFALHFPRPGRRTGQRNRAILLAKLDAAGDLVLFAGSVERYRRLFPGWRIVLLVRSTTSDLASTIPDVDELWVLRTARYRWNIAERLSWRRRISSASFAVAVNCSYSSSARHLDALIGWSAAPRRIAMECLDSVDGRQKKGLYFTELIPASSPWLHETERHRELLRYLGDTEATSPHAAVFLTPADRSVAAQFVGEEHSLPLVVVSPGAGSPDRRWPRECFVEAIRRVHHDSPHLWLICGSADEFELCGWISAQLPDVPTRNLAGRTDLRQLAAIIERAVCVLGNESAAVHIATALFVPAVCILGGGFYGRFLPMPGESLTRTVVNRLPCYGCYWKCTRQRIECVLDVRVDDAVTALRQALGGATARRPRVCI